MAKYVIKEDDSSEGLAAGAIILVFALLFILSPGIVITSLIYYIIDSMTSNHSIFRYDNFIGCFSADKIKMSVRK